MEVNFAELRQSDRYAEYMRRIGWEVGVSPTGVKAYLMKMPLVPVRLIKVQRVRRDEVDFEWLKEVARQNRVVVTYVEVVDGHPFLYKNSANEVDAGMAAWGYRSTGSGMLPTRTLLVDLGGDEEQILGAMKAKTRYNIGLAERNKLTVEIVSGKKMVDDTGLQGEWLALLTQNAKRIKVMFKPLWLTAQLEVFGDNGYGVCIRDKNSELIAVAVFLTASGVSYYGQNGSTMTGRRSMAPTLAVWEGMREAKRRRLRALDFDGVYDERHPIPRFKGFSRFKRGFGGEVVDYPPAYRRFLPLFG